MRSPLIKADYWLESCREIFGENIGAPQVEFSNSIFGGMEITGSNIYFANANEDPWQYAGMRSIYNPETQSNMRASLIECANCGHCIDIATPADTDPKELLDVREAIHSQILVWLAEAEQKEKLSLFLQ